VLVIGLIPHLYIGVLTKEAAMVRSFRVLAATDRGLVREGNEDAGLISPQLIAVADGMGGHAAGEVASKIAITSLAQLGKILDDGNIDDESREDLLLNICYSIDQEILERTSEDGSLSGMGTTLTALHLTDHTIELLHIGDSRAYRWNGKRLSQISVDHTVMQELIDQGRLTQEEVHQHPQRSLLTQALMGDSGIDPVLISLDAKTGEKFLLCSDGLSSVLSDHEIEHILKKSDESQILEKLISATKAKGAPDNITILWAEIVDTPLTHTELLGAANE
jgi:PPM family protein phosphatase